MISITSYICDLTSVQIQFYDLQYNLYPIFKNYEDTGNGYGQRQYDDDEHDKNDPKWGRVEVFNRLNIINFLLVLMNTADYLLYFLALIGRGILGSIYVGKTSERTSSG